MKKILILHGQQRKRGSNYNISWNLARKLATHPTHIKEHFVNAIPFCVGCSRCILKGEEHCPHHGTIAPIAKDVEEADILIINSPTYVMEMTGQLKAFFDHMAYRFIIHRPHPSMHRKVAVLISTAAGSGARRVTKSLKNQMLWWGVGKSYTMSFSVFSTDWQGVKGSMKQKIARKTSSVARTVLRQRDVKRGLKGQLYFDLMNLLQKKMNNPIDIAYRKEHGWMK